MQALASASNHIVAYLCGISSKLVEGIRDMLCKPELMEDLIQNMHLHNLETD